jgi:hypothetical protein
MSVEAFAGKRGIPVGTLKWWMWRLRREKAEESTPLLPVRVVASAAPTARLSSDESAAAQVEVALADDLRLRFAGAPADLIVEVVSRLRRC